MRWASAVLAALVLLPGLSGCASDRELVTDGLAARHYNAGRAAQLCECSTTLPATCAPKAQEATAAGCLDYARAIDALLREVNLQDSTIVIGRLPKEARARLKALEKRVAKAGEMKP